MLEFDHLPIQDGTAIGILVANGHAETYGRIGHALHHRIFEENQAAQRSMLALYKPPGDKTRYIETLVDTDIATLIVFLIGRSPQGPRDHYGQLHLILAGLDEYSECVARLSRASWIPLNLYHPPKHSTVIHF